MTHIIVGVCREDNPRDVDEAYGEGTYARLFGCANCGELEEDHAAYGGWCAAESEDDLWSTTKKYTVKP